MWELIIIRSIGTALFERMTRTGSDRTVRFVFNNDKEKTFTLFGEPCTLKPFEMKIV